MAVNYNLYNNYISVSKGDYTHPVESAVLPTITTSSSTTDKNSLPENATILATIIEPSSYKLNKFCKYTDCRNPRICGSLNKYNNDNNFDSSRSDDDDSDDNGNEIYNPKYPYLTKTMMREYIDIFTFKELFRNNLLYRLNESQKVLKRKTECGGDCL